MRSARVLAILLLICMTCCSTAEELNRKLPDVTLEDIDGNKVSLSQFKGKVLVIDFWGSWCLPCLEAIEKLKTLKDKYGDRGFEIIGIAVKDNLRNVLNIVKIMKVNYVVLMGNDATRYMFGGVKAVPTTFVVDRDGIMRYRFEGKEGVEQLEKAIVPLLESGEGGSK